MEPASATTVVATITDKDLILVILSAIVSLLFALFGKYVPSYLVNYNKVTPFLGNPWFTYHWSRADGKPSFRQNAIQFKRRLYGIQADMTDEKGKKMVYRGNITFDGKDVLLEFLGRKHSEQFQIRLNDPIEHEDTKMIGILLAVDFDREKYSSIYLCSRSKKSEQEAKKLISEYTDFSPGESGLRVVIRK